MIIASAVESSRLSVVSGVSNSSRPPESRHMSIFYPVAVTVRHDDDVGAFSIAGHVTSSVVGIGVAIWPEDSAVFVHVKVGTPG